MSNLYHAIVWIDHQQARVFQFDAAEVDSAVIRSTHPHAHIHHKANSGDSGHVPVDKAYLRNVAEAISHAGAVLVVGPGNAKKELSTFLETQAPSTAAKVVGVEPLDHPTDGALLAFARKYFKVEDRMRPQLSPGAAPAE